MLKHEPSRPTTTNDDDYELKRVHCPKCEYTWRSQNPEASLYAHMTWAHSIEMDGHAHV